MAIPMDAQSNFSSNVTSFWTPDALDECKSPDVYFTSLDVRFLGLSFIIPGGFVCNSLSAVVFMSPSMRRRASSWYLAALAVSDNLSLVAVAFDYWLKDDRIGIKIIKNSPFVCVTVSHLSYASRLLSSTLITTFTVERFIGIVYPLRRSLLISIEHARRVIGIEVLVCTCLATFTIFTIGIDTTQKQKLGFNDTDCDIITEMTRIYAGFNVAFLIVGSIVAPVFVIVTLNAAILSRIIGRGARLDLLGLNPAASTGLNFSETTSMNYSVRSLVQQHQQHQWHHYEHSVTLVLLVVSTTFVVLNVPYCVCWFLLFIRVSFNAQSSSCDEIQLLGRLHAAKYIASLPYYLNYSINFALYAVCAHSFRTQLCHFVVNLLRRLTGNTHTDSSRRRGIEVVGTGDAGGNARRRAELAATDARTSRRRLFSEPPVGSKTRHKADEMELSKVVATC